MTTHVHPVAVPLSTHDTTRIDDTRIGAVRPLITPALLNEWLPTPPEAQALVERSRAALSRVLHGTDDRLIVVVGPCSIHDHDQAIEYARALKEQAAALKLTDRVVPFRKRTAPMYDIGASAGTGQFLDSDSYEMVEVPDDVPDSATFGIHVCGDSMEPTLEDGQEIWVQMQPTLESGDIGVFYLDGNAFVKEYRRTDKGVFLVSHNEKYEPIPITDYVESRIYGKVVYPR